MFNRLRPGHRRRAPRRPPAPPTTQVQPPGPPAVNNNTLTLVAPPTLNPGTRDAAQNENPVNLEIPLEPDLRILRNHIGRQLGEGDNAHLDNVSRIVHGSHEILLKEIENRNYGLKLSRAKKFALESNFRDVVFDSDRLHSFERGKLTILGGSRPCISFGLTGMRLSAAEDAAKNSTAETPVSLTKVNYVATPNRENLSSTSSKLWTKLRLSTQLSAPSLQMGNKSNCRISNNFLTYRLASKVAIGNTQGMEEEEIVRKYEEESNGTVDLDNPRDILKWDQISDDLVQFNAKFDLDLSIVEFSGDTFHCPIQNLLFDEHSVYLINCDVLNLLSSDNETRVNELEKLRNWILSVRYHAPNCPFLILGSYPADAKESDGLLPRIDKELRNELDKWIPHNLFLNNDEGLCFFPVVEPLNLSEEVQTDDTIARPREAEAPPGSKELVLNELLNFTRKKMDSVTAYETYNKQMEKICITVETIMHSSRPLIRRHVSLRWLRFMEAVLALKEKKIGLHDLRTLADATSGIQSMHDVEICLQILHEQGFIVYFPKTDILSNTAILKPEWLIETLNKVFSFHTAYARNEHFHGEFTGLDHDADLLVNHGFASRDLLDYIWDSEAADVDFLVDVMKKMMYMSDYKFGGNSELFFLPSYISLESESQEEKNFSKNGKRMKIDFNGLCIPQGLFHRLVCLFVNHSGNMPNSKDPLLRPSIAQVYFGNIPVTLWHDKNHKDVIYVSVGRDPDKRRQTVSMRSCISSVQTMVRKVMEETSSKTVLSWKIMLECQVGDSLQFLGLKDAKVKAKRTSWFPNTKNRVQSGATNLTYDEITDFAQMI